MAASARIGQLGEQKARAYLEQQGLIFLYANYTAKTGELDLVMQDDQTIVCIEVKYRDDDAYGSAVDFVTPSKLRKVKRTFEHYLLSRGLNPIHTLMRVDVVALDGDKLNWLKNV